MLVSVERLSGLTCWEHSGPGKGEENQEEWKEGGGEGPGGRITAIICDRK